MIFSQYFPNLLFCSHWCVTCVHMKKTPENVISADIIPTLSRRIGCVCVFCAWWHRTACACGINDYFVNFALTNLMSWISFAEYLHHTNWTMRSMMWNNYKSQYEIIARKPCRVASVYDDEEAWLELLRQIFLNSGNSQKRRFKFEQRSASFVRE